MTVSQPSKQCLSFHASSLFLHNCWIRTICELFLSDLSLSYWYLSDRAHCELKVFFDKWRSTLSAECRITEWTGAAWAMMAAGFTVTVQGLWTASRPRIFFSVNCQLLGETVVLPDFRNLFSLKHMEESIYHRWIAERFFFDIDRCDEKDVPRNGLEQAEFQTSLGSEYWSCIRQVASAKKASGCETEQFILIAPI